MHLFQVGAGSGGMAVLDLVARDPRVTGVTLVEPDVYAPHNVHRHLFPPAAVGRLKAELAAEWVRAIRPDIVFESLVADLTDASRQVEFARLVAGCDVGVCAADNEAAKFAFDALMRAAGKPWTLGEVLSGGIGGWVHRFAPGGACYGCVASHLKREVTEQPAGPPPDYSAPSATQPEATIPASKASIAIIAGLHAMVTLGMLEGLPPVCGKPTPPGPPSLKGRGETDTPGSAPSNVAQEASREFTPFPSAGLREAPLTGPATEPRGAGGVGLPQDGKENANPIPPSEGGAGSAKPEKGAEGVSPPDFTSLLFSLRVVPGVFDVAFRPHRLRVARSPTCLTCGTPAPTPTGDALDAAVADALARLGAG